MRMRITDYRIGDKVDVYCDSNDDYDDFNGVVVNIDVDNNILMIKDEYDDIWDIPINKVKLTYNEEKESEINYYE